MNKKEMSRLVLYYDKNDPAPMIFEMTHRGLVPLMGFESWKEFGAFIASGLYLYELYTGETMVKGKQQSSDVPDADTIAKDLDNFGKEPKDKTP